MKLTEEWTDWLTETGHLFKQVPYPNHCWCPTETAPNLKQSEALGYAAKRRNPELSDVTPEDRWLVFGFIGLVDRVWVDRVG